MASDPFKTPEIVTLLRELEGIDEQINELSEKRRHLLNKLEKMEV